MGRRIGVGTADLPEGTLADTSQEHKVEEIDLAVKVDGLGTVSKDKDWGRQRTCGLQHTAPIAGR